MWEDSDVVTIGEYLLVTLEVVGYDSRLDDNVTIVLGIRSDDDLIVVPYRCVAVVTDELDILTIDIANETTYSADVVRNLLTRRRKRCPVVAVYITGAMPVRVTAMPVYAPEPTDPLFGLSLGDRAAIVMCQNDDGSVYRVTGCAGFGAHENSYRICGVKGQIENVRGSGGKIMLRYNKWELPEGAQTDNYYKPEWDDADKALIEKAGHGGGDFYVIREFFNCIRENRRPEFDVYFATKAASVGILAHRSILNGNMPYDVPDFRKEEDRVKYENDHLSPFFGPNGELPTIQACSHGSAVKSDEEIAAHEAFLASIEE